MCVDLMNWEIVVIGMGYVGIPAAAMFANVEAYSVFAPPSIVLTYLTA